VLGQNARLHLYTAKDDSRAAAMVANDKAATKKALQKAGLPTPTLFAKITSRQELQKFRWTKLPSSFVIKPRTSYGGSGIQVIFGRNKKGNWVKADKTEVFIPELKKHISDILDGSFSPSKAPDVALIEQRVKIHPDLKPYSLQGVPDVRVIVYNSVPVMAMLRLSTTESHGRANLHAGGVGVGIDLARGVTTTAVYRGQPIDTLPQSHLPLTGIRVPHWLENLHIAVKAAQVIGLPFAGVDLAIDRDQGPMVLEINVRPGLDIQLANMSPLRSRLQRVEDLKITNPKKGVKIGIDLFGSDTDQEIEDITGKNILGIVEQINILDLEGEPHPLSAKIDTGAWRTTLDQKLARRFNLHHKIIRRKEVRGSLGLQTRPIIELSYKIHDQKITTQAFMADRSNMKYPIIIGRRDLKNFLVDPYKNARGMNEDQAS